LRRPFPALSTSPLLPFPSAKALPLPSILLFPFLQNPISFLALPVGKIQNRPKKTQGKNILGPDPDFFSKFRVESKYCRPKNALESKSPREYLHCGMVSKANTILDGNITVETCEARVKASRPRNTHHAHGLFTGEATA
jgi:hypothetical protein